MTSLPLITQTTQKYLVIGVLVIMFIGMVVAVGIFFYSLWKQRQYNSTSLPSIEVETEEDLTEEPGSAFALADLEEPISKSAYATRLDDFSLETLPQLPGAKYEPEEVGLPSLDSLDPVTSPAAQPTDAQGEPVRAADETLYDEPHEDYADSPLESTAYEWDAPEVDEDDAYEHLPSSVAVEPALPAPVPAPAVQEEQIKAEYSSFHDGEWKTPQSSDYPTPVENEALPQSSLPEQAYPSFFGAQSASPEAEALEELPAPVEPEHVNVAPSPEPSANSETPRRGFRKLRMPVDKIKTNAEDEVQATEDPTDESYVGRRKSNAPTDSL